MWARWIGDSQLHLGARPQAEVRHVTKYLKAAWLVLISISCRPPPPPPTAASFSHLSKAHRRQGVFRGGTFQSGSSLQTTFAGSETTRARRVCLPWEFHMTTNGWA